MITSLGVEGSCPRLFLRLLWISHPGIWVVLILSLLNSQDIPKFYLNTLLMGSQNILSKGDRHGVIQKPRGQELGLFLVINFRIYSIAMYRHFNKLFQLGIYLISLPKSTQILSNFSAVPMLDMSSRTMPHPLVHSSSVGWGSNGSGRGIRYQQHQEECPHFNGFKEAPT